MKAILLLVAAIWLISWNSYAAHPSVILTPSVVASLKAKQSKGDADWAAVKAKADRYLTNNVASYVRTGCANNNICYDYEGSGWLDAIENLGVAYQVTGNVSYANKVIAIIDAANAVYKNSGTLTVDANNNKRVTASGWNFSSADVNAYLRVDGGAGWTTGWYQISSVSGSGAILNASPAGVGTTGGIWSNVIPESIDSGYASRNAALGVAFAFDWVYDQLDSGRKTDTINTLNAWYDWMKAFSYRKSGPIFSNYFAGHLIGFAAIGYATAGDNSRASEIQNFMLGLWNSTSAAFTTGGAQGGYPAESFNTGYGPSAYRWAIQYMQMVKDNGGGDLGITTYGQLMATSLLYNLKPNRWQATDEGDFPNNSWFMPGNYPSLLASALNGTTAGAFMQFYYQHLATPPSGGISTQAPSAFEKFLYDDSKRRSTDYRVTQSTSYRSRGDEHIYVRSDWTDNAVWASFKAGASSLPTDHVMLNAGHIAVQRGNDYLLVNSGQWHGLNGVGGNPQSFDLSGWRTNTLFFDDGGSYLRTGGVYVGGQEYYGSNSILAYDAGTNYVYSKADLKSAYDISPPVPAKRSLTGFIRSFLFLGDKYFVVWDRITASSPVYTKKLFWHFNPIGMPTVSGNLVQSTVGGSTLYLDTLLPAAPVISVVADGVKGITDTTPITYRVEVSDSATGNNLNALHVIEATSSRDNFPAVSMVNVTGGNMVGALIADASPRVVLLSADGTPQSGVTYTASYSSGVTGNHVIADLAPGAYNVLRDGQQIFRMLSTTAAGVLSFRATGGTTWTITTQGVVPGTIAKISGDLQTGLIDSALANPLVVKVVAPNNVSLAGVSVNFTVTGPATLSADSVNTDDNGFASVTVDLLPLPGPVTVQASNFGLGGSPVTFNLTAMGIGLPQIGAVVNGSSFTGPPITSGSIASLFGTNLAPTSDASSTVPLPTSLAGTSVQVSGFDSPLFFVSPLQINFQIPWEVSGLLQADVTVTTDGGTSDPQTISLSPFAPGLFTTNATGTGQGAMLIASSGEIAAPIGSIPGAAARPAQRGETISIYGTGLGAVTSQPATGTAASDNPLSATTTIPVVTIGGVPSQITDGFFSGLAPNYIGLYQVNVQVPQDTPTGDAVPVMLSIGGVTSNSVNIAVQ